MNQKTYLQISESLSRRKRGFDLMMIVLFTPVWIPLMLICSLLVKFNSKGPVFYQQERIGKRGEPFTVVKFRSMIHHSESRKISFTEVDDPRITATGRFLRRYRLDELPQIWNVIKGEMSLIGPRTEQSVFVNQFRDNIENYELRHSVRPGITGLAQVRQGYVTTPAEMRHKLRYDLFYIRNRSFKLDLYILLSTVRTVLLGEGI